MPVVRVTKAENKKKQQNGEPRERHGQENYCGVDNWTVHTMVNHLPHELQGSRIDATSSAWIVKGKGPLINETESKKVTNNDTTLTTNRNKGLNDHTGITNSTHSSKYHGPTPMISKIPASNDTNIIKTSKKSVSSPRTPLAEKKDEAHLNYLPSPKVLQNDDDYNICRLDDRRRSAVQITTFQRQKEVLVSEEETKELRFMETRHKSSSIPGRDFVLKSAVATTTEDFAPASSCRSKSKSNELASPSSLSSSYGDGNILDLKKRLAKVTANHRRKSLDNNTRRKSMNLVVLQKTSVTTILETKSTTRKATTSTAPKATLDKNNPIQSEGSKNEQLCLENYCHDKTTNAMLTNSDAEACSIASLHDGIVTTNTDDFVQTSERKFPCSNAVTSSTTTPSITNVGDNSSTVSHSCSSSDMATIPAAVSSPRDGIAKICYANTELQPSKTSVNDDVMNQGKEGGVFVSETFAADSQQSQTTSMDRRKRRKSLRLLERRIMADETDGAIVPDDNSAISNQAEHQQHDYKCSSATENATAEPLCVNNTIENTAAASIISSPPLTCPPFRLRRGILKRKLRYTKNAANISPATAGTSFYFIDKDSDDPNPSPCKKGRILSAKTTGAPRSVSCDGSDTRMLMMEDGKTGRNTDDHDKRQQLHLTAATSTGGSSDLLKLPSADVLEKLSKNFFSLTSGLYSDEAQYGDKGYEKAFKSTMTHDVLMTAIYFVQQSENLNNCCHKKSGSAFHTASIDKKVVIEAGNMGTTNSDGAGTGIAFTLFQIFRNLFKAFMEYECAVTNHSTGDTCINFDRIPSNNLHYDDDDLGKECGGTVVSISAPTTLSLPSEVQEPDRSNYLGCFEEEKNDSALEATTATQQKEEYLLEEQVPKMSSATTLATANSHEECHTRRGKAKVSFCTMSVVTPAVDKLINSHIHRQRCILALDKVLDEASGLVSKSKSYLWKDYVLNQVIFELERLINGLNVILKHDPKHGYNSSFELIDDKAISHSKRLTAFQNVAQRLKSDIQGILDSCVNHPTIQLSNSFGNSPNDNPHPTTSLLPSVIMPCPLSNVQLDILLSSQIRFHLRRLFDVPPFFFSKATSTKCPQMARDYSYARSKVHELVILKERPQCDTSDNNNSKISPHNLDKGDTTNEYILDDRNISFLLTDALQVIFPYYDIHQHKLLVNFDAIQNIIGDVKSLHCQTQQSSSLKSLDPKKSTEFQHLLTALETLSHSQELFLFGACQFLVELFATKGVIEAVDDAGGWKDLNVLSNLINKNCNRFSVNTTTAVNKDTETWSISKPPTKEFATDAEMTAKKCSASEEGTTSSSSNNTIQADSVHSSAAWSATACYNSVSHTNASHFGLLYKVDEGLCKECQRFMKEFRQYRANIIQLLKMLWDAYYCDIIRKDLLKKRKYIPLMRDSIQQILISLRGGNFPIVESTEESESAIGFGTSIDL